MRICPFCMSKIESNHVDFLFEKEFTDWDFMYYMGAVDGFVLNAREDRKYRKFREKKKLSTNDRTDVMRVYVNHEELYGMVNILRKRCGENALEHVWDENNRIDEQFSFDNGEDLNVQYHNRENEDSVLEIRSGMQVARGSMICSHCHNQLPSGFFHYPQITIGLIGKKDAGKTCMLISLLADNMKAINGSSDVISFTEAQSIHDSGYQELYRKVRLLEEQGICPDPTRGEFIPPVILKADWKIEEETRRAMICIYDAAGELLEKASENTDILDNIVHTDGWLYLIDPQNTRLSAMMETLSKENKLKILEKALIEPIYQQRKLQQDQYRKNHRTVHDIMQELLSDINTEAQIRNFYNHLCQCVGSGFSDDNRVPEVALILSKADVILPFLNERYGEEAVLFERGRNYISSKGSERWKDRKEILKEIFEEYVIDVDNLNIGYAKTPDVYLASALGCSTKQEYTEDRTLIYKVDGRYDPIRVGEAFVRMTMNLMQSRLGRNDE